MRSVDRRVAKYVVVLVAMLGLWIRAARDRRESTPTGSGPAVPATSRHPWPGRASCSTLRLANREDGLLRGFAWSSSGKELLLWSATKSPFERRYQRISFPSLEPLQSVTIESASEVSPLKATAVYAANDELIVIGQPAHHRHHLWHPKTNQLVRLEPETSVTDVSVSPDGRHALVASAWGPQVLFDARTGDAGPKLDIGRGSSTMSMVEQWLPDGGRLVTSSALAAVYAWDLDARTVRPLVPEDATAPAIGVPNLGISPDGELLAIVLPNGTLELWSVDEFVRLKTLRSGSWECKGDYGVPHGLAFSPDGRWLLTAFADGSAWVHALPSGTPSYEVAESRFTADDTVAFVASWGDFSPDGKLFFTSSHSLDFTSDAYETNIFEMGAPPRRIRTVPARGPTIEGWGSSGHSLRRWRGKQLEIWDPVTNASAEPAPPATTHPRAELVGGDLHVEASGRHALTVRLLPSGRLLLVGRDGCTNGDGPEARAQLRTANGIPPSPEQLRRSYRADLAHSLLDP